MNTRQISRADVHIRSTYYDGTRGLHLHCAGPHMGEWQLDAIKGLNAGVIWSQRGYNWAPGHSIDLYRQWLVQRGPYGLVRLVLDGAGLTRRQIPNRSVDGFPVGLPISKESIR